VAFGINAYRKTLGLEKQTEAAPEREPPPMAPPAAPSGKAEGKYRRVAKFLVLIGAEQAAVILKNLDGEQVELISKEIATIHGITREEAESVFEEFRRLLEQGAAYAYGGQSAGGIEAARNLLYAAFGAEKGESLLRRAVPETEKEASERYFGFLEDFSPEQVAVLLADESPATGALVLSRIAPKISAEVLALNDSQNWKLETVKRIASAGQVSPEVLTAVANALKEKARRLGGGEDAERRVDGVGTLAAILKYSDVAFGDKILQKLDEADPDLGQNLKERLYTADDVSKADDRKIAEKLRAMSDKELVYLVKGRAGDFADKILSNISAGRREVIRQEIAFAGPLPKKDVDEALRQFMAWFRSGVEEGQIILSDEKGVIV
jgi:flagellar motor switch protein FliG